MRQVRQHPLGEPADGAILGRPENRAESPVNVAHAEEHTP